MKTIKVDPNKPSHILVSIPIIGLATFGVVKTLEWVRDKGWWFTPPVKKA